MGMDVYGVKPTSEKGEYFRNNVWWWRPLAHYCMSNHPDIASRCEGWQYNSGDGLDDYDASQLGERIIRDLDSGRAEMYLDEFRNYKASLPMEECGLCSGTGVRTDDVGVSLGFTDRELSEETALFMGRTHGWCNGCEGVGKKESMFTWYEFDLDNLREFADFLLACGGFQIY